MSVVVAKKNTRSQVSDLNPASYNPRKITDEQLARLGAAMKEFGDLSGIVVNIRTGNNIDGQPYPIDGFHYIEHKTYGKSRVRFVFISDKPNEKTCSIIAHRDTDKANNVWHDYKKLGTSGVFFYRGRRRAEKHGF